VQIKHFLVENLLYGNIRPSSVSEQRIVTGGSRAGEKPMIEPKSCGSPIIMNSNRTVVRARLGV
jgi:hypothetical protein